MYAILYLFAVPQERAHEVNSQHSEMRNERFMLFIWFSSHNCVRAVVQEFARHMWLIG